MTVQSTERRAGPYFSGTSLPFGFKIFSNEDVAVVRLSATGVETRLVLDSDYSVSLNPDQDNNPGGDVVLFVSIGGGESVTIIGDVDYEQPADIRNQTGFQPEIVENALDRVVFLCQQLLELANRTLQLPVSTTSNVRSRLPPPQPNSLIAWNGLGDGLQNLDPSEFAQVVAYGTAEADLFSGDGTTKDFVLSRSPGALNNLDVSINGDTKRPSVDYTWPTGTTIRFAVAPPVGTQNILVRYMRGLPQAEAPELDPAQLLELLEGQITEAQLFSALGQRINLIDGNGVGSVNQRLANQAGVLNSNISTAVASLAEDVFSAILSESTTRAGADSALASQVTSLQSTVASNTAAIQSEATTRANADSAIASQISTLQSNVAGNAAAISSESSARADADTALASQINTVQATANSNTVAISSEATARATADGQLFGQYTVKIDAGGKVAGFGLASTAPDTGAASTEFAIRADRFYVAAPAGVGGLADAIPFIVVTAPFDLNGVTVPPGVYMADAFIRNGSILAAKIADAAITTAKIQDAAITNAKIANLSAEKINAGTLETARLSIDGLKLANVAGVLTVDGQQVTLMSRASGNSATQYWPPGTTSIIASNFSFPVRAKAGSIIQIILYLRASDDIGTSPYMYGYVRAAIFPDSGRRYPLSSFPSSSETYINQYDQNTVAQPALGRFCTWVQPISLPAVVDGENWVHMEVDAFTHTGYDAGASRSNHSYVAMGFASS